MTSWASAFSHQFVQVNILTNPSGLGGQLSMTIHESARLIVEGESNFDDAWNFGGGAGFFAPVNSVLDIKGDIIARSQKNDRYDNTIGKFGVELNLGFRAWVAPQVEFAADVGRFMRDGKDYTIVNLIGRYHPTDLVSVNAEWRMKGENDGQFVLGVRFPF
ncbi:hypothetical protein [Thaumasiovibrio subtropicus]|uniref:hypothetical protein n=1 Tax=Thaumasiovibrio subtropicus TaxID=1891207 RepID=UPI000B355170|nr:hypothetical protein [Thaumasiovibrio subtropicus]